MHWELNPMLIVLLELMAKMMPAGTEIIQRQMNNGKISYIIYINDTVALITRNKDIILNYQQGK
jgi:hypothetical protein